ncbi:sensor domain-containing diguanylate cyclase [Radicibacter daui]|uniref:sensor domain-containing diguanylate cyclase n=1 Tax=Radicibacter daui TaxID=3064829 RepID=UPI004046C41A
MRLPVIAIRPLIGLVLTLFCLVSVGACLALTGLLAARHETMEIGEDLATSAGVMSSKLQERMAARLHDVQLTASILHTAADMKAARPLLDDLAAQMPAYAWIGVTDAKGTVEASTGGILEGANVSERPWFRFGFVQPYLGDVHEAVLLAKYLPPDQPGSQEPLRFVDVSAPVHNAAGETVGVVGAHLSWRWISAIGSVLTTTGKSDASALLLDAAGRVIAGAPFGTELSSLASVTRARAGGTGFVREMHPDGQDYMVGYTVWQPDPALGSLKWIVLAREPASRAFQPVRQLMHYILAVGGALLVFGLIAAWMMARAIAAPLTGLAAAARALRAGPDAVATLPRAYGLKEVSELSLALRSMVLRLSVVERRHELLQEEGAQKTRRLESDLTTARQQADTDPLTGLFNRRALMRDGAALFDRLRGQQRSFSAVILDIDHFKQVNDRFGHMVGDTAIRFVVDVAGKSCRDSDLLARVGGEEFVILLPGADLGAAEELAERLRERIEQTSLVIEGNHVPLTISLGCAEAAGMEDLQGLLDRADRALYAAKSEGRNRVRRAAAV